MNNSFVIRGQLLSKSDLKINVLSDYLGNQIEIYTLTSINLDKFTEGNMLYISGYIDRNHLIANCICKIHKLKKTRWI